METIAPTITAQELKEQAAKLQEQAAKIEQEAQEKAYEEERKQRQKAAEDQEIKNIQLNGPKVRSIVEAIRGLGVELNYTTYDSTPDSIKKALNEFGGVFYRGRYLGTDLTLESHPTITKSSKYSYTSRHEVAGVVGLRAEWYDDRRRFNKLYKVASWDKAIEHLTKKIIDIKKREDDVAAAKKAKENKKLTTEESIRACFENAPYDIKIEEAYSNYSISYSRTRYMPTGTYNVTLYKPGTYERVTGYSNVYLDKDGKVKGMFTQTVDIKEHYNATPQKD